MCTPHRVFFCVCLFSSKKMDKVTEALGYIEGAKEYVDKVANAGLLSILMIVALTVLGLYVFGKIREWSVQVLDSVFWVLWQMIRIILPAILAIGVYHLAFHSHLDWKSAIYSHASQ